MSLKSDYTDACNAYLKAFCEMYGFDYDPKDWVGDDPGGFVDVGDYYVGMDTIRTAVDREAPAKEFFKWYDYCMDCGHLELSSPNFDAWLRCCPRLSDEEIQELFRRKRKIEKMKEEFREMIAEKRSTF